MMRRITFWLGLVGTIFAIAAIMSPSRTPSKFKHPKDCVGCIENHTPAMNLGVNVEEQ